MRRTSYFVFAFLILSLSALVVQAAPYFTFQRSLLPADSTENIGTSTAPWDTGFFNTICLSGDCKSAWPTGGSGSSGLATTTPWTVNQLVQVVSDGVVRSIATSSLGLLTTNVAEGSNLYFTDTRARNAISETITGIDYASGVFSITSGYGIPTTAKQTEWDTAYSNRITSLTTTGSSGAATLIGNVLNIPQYAGTTYTATYPVTLSGSAFGLAFGTTSSNTWGGTQTFSNTISGSISGNAGTATALAANGTNASAGNAILGVDASGNAEGAFDVWTEAENTAAAYTPQSRTLTVAGTANQVTSSAGAQSLAADRTWTLSLPSHVIFPGNFQATNATTTNATTTALDITSLLTFNGVTGSTWSAFCTAITGGAGLCDGTDATGGGGAGALATSTADIATGIPYYTSSNSYPAYLANEAAFTYSSTSDRLTVVNASTTNITSTGGAQFATSNGSVGVGNATPSYKLDVSGFINTDQFSGYKQNGNTVLYASTTNTSLALGASAAAGWMSATSSSFNTVAIGQGALAATPTTGSATYNVGIGSSALAANTTGYRNVALGGLALLANTEGYNNFALGFFSTRLNTTGHDNVAIGALTLFNSNSSNNVAIGSQALTALTSGTDNTAIGMNSMLLNTTGGSSVGIGSGALINNASATNTTAIGTGAGLGTASYSNQGGTYIGYLAGRGSATGSDYNTFVGYQAGYGITTGTNNLIIGNATSSANIQNLTTGSQNILIGNNNALPSSTANGQLNIGNIIYGTGVTGTGTTISSGSIGIGTTTPGRAFSVQGSANLSGNLFAAGITATGTLNLPALADGCLNVTSGAVGSTGSACGSGGGSSFGKSWEIDGSGFLAPTTTIDVFIPSELRFNASTKYIANTAPGFTFNTDDYFTFGTGGAPGFTLDTTDGFWLPNNQGYRQKIAGGTVNTILNIDGSDILTVGNSSLAAVVAGTSVTVPALTNGTLYANGSGLLSAQTGTTGYCVEWGANGALVDAASAAACGKGPAGTGTELQFRVDGTTFGAISNSAYINTGAFEGNVGIGSTTPWALLSIASSTWGGLPDDYNRPLFAVATSSDVYGNLFSVFATSTEQMRLNTRISTNLGVRAIIGGLVKPFQQFFVNGSTGSTWKNQFCDTMPVSGTAISVDTASFCGFMAFDEGSTGTITETTVSNPASRAASMAVGSAATLDQVNLRFDLFDTDELATTTPSMEVIVGPIAGASMSTTTQYTIGWMSDANSTNESSRACQIVATSSPATWRAICKEDNFGTQTIVDTGVAYNQISRFRLEWSPTSFRVLRSSDPSAPLNTVATIGSSGFPTTNVNLFAAIKLRRVTGGTPISPALVLVGVRYWSNSPWNWQQSQ